MVHCTQLVHQLIKCTVCQSAGRRSAVGQPERRAAHHDLLLSCAKLVHKLIECTVCQLQVDSTPWESLSAEDRATIEAMGAEAAKLSSGGEPRV
jgi:hypothetical protein